MQALFWVGLVVILGVASLVVSIPHTEREALTVGGLSLDVEARLQEELSPALSAAMILDGLGAMVVGRRNS